MDWYIGEDRVRSVREVVIDVAKPEPVDPKFGMMFLGEAYHILRSSVWVAGLFRMDGDPDPYLMLRSDKYTGLLKNQRFRIAFCFYHLRAGGLFAVFIDFPEVKFPGAPSAPYVLFEMIRGLDHEDERRLIEDALKPPQLRICFTEGDGPGEDLPGGGWAGGSINAQYDVLVDLDPGCRKALKKEWKALFKHHKSVPEDARDFGAITEQMASENPTTHNPIVDRDEGAGGEVKAPSGDHEAGSPSRASSPRKWWQFWK